jgi:hypothetical protein
MVNQKCKELFYLKLKNFSKNYNNTEFYFYLFKTYASILLNHTIKIKVICSFLKSYTKKERPSMRAFQDKSQSKY